MENITQNIFKILIILLVFLLTSQVNNLNACKDLKLENKKYEKKVDKFIGKISKIDKKLKNKMLKAGSWKKGCPIGIENLVYIQMNYWDFNYKKQLGEIIVHKDVAKDVVSIFKELFEIKYPFKSIKLISDFDADDYKSMNANNTSSFNCRKVTNSKKWSNHSYGKAIDINPIQNPYIRRDKVVEPSIAKKYIDRKIKDKAIIRKNDKVYKAFKKYKWFWGGDWRTVKDYQHFEKK